MLYERAIAYLNVDIAVEGLCIDITFISSLLAL